MKLRTLGDELFHADRKKYRHMEKPIVCFRNFANEPKNDIVWGQSLGHDKTNNNNQKEKKTNKRSKSSALDEITGMRHCEYLFKRSVHNTRIGLDNTVMSFSAMLSAYRSQINLKTGGNGIISSLTVTGILWGAQSQF